MVIMAIEATVTDCIDSDFSSSLPSLRRQDIVTGLTSQLSPLLRTTFTFLNQCVQQFLSLASGDSSHGTERIVDLVGSVLKMVAAITGFAKPGDVCTDEHDFATAVVDLLSLPGIQIDAVDLLHSITHSKVPDAMFARLLEKISKTEISHFPEDLSESITFQRTYAEAVYALVSHNITRVIDPLFLSIPQAQTILGQYVTLMAKLLAQPSRRLASDVLADWTKVG